MRDHREPAHRRVVDPEPLVHERGQPREQDVQRPVAAEVRDDDRPDRRVHEEGSERRRRTRPHRWRARLDQGEFLRPYPRMLGGLRRHQALPGDEPQHAHGAEQIERPLPAQPLDDVRRRDEGEYRAERNAAIGAPDRPRALLEGDPAAVDAVDRGKGQRLAHAHRDARGQQDAEASQGGRRGQHREQRPQQHADPEHDLSTKAVRQAPAHDLEHQVSHEERGQHGALGPGRPAEILRHGNDRDGNVDAIDVTDEDREKGEPDDHGAAGDPRRSERHGLSRSGRGSSLA